MLEIVPVLERQSPSRLLLGALEFFLAKPEKSLYASQFLSEGA
jgi:hypothetical protein